MGAISKADRLRAVNKFPGVEFKGHGVGHMAHTLNTHLQRMATSDKVNLRRCEDMDHSELHALQLQIVRAAHPDFQKIYQQVGDNRRFRFCGEAALAAEYAEQARMVEHEPLLGPVLRDSQCRETVMWWVHHLRNEEKQTLNTPLFVLPTLPTEELRPVPAVMQASPEAAKAIYQAYDESLSCASCHTNGPSKSAWPSNAGVNNKTGVPVPAWPDQFSVDFVLEVTTEAGEKGLPNITNATGNTFHYSFDSQDPSKSRAVNQHETCPFFNTMSCNIHHHPDAIYLHINPTRKFGSLCCRFTEVGVIPPYWTTWGQYVNTYAKGAPVPGEAAPNWEGFEVDRYIFGDHKQLDEHDLHVRTNDPSSMVRFHATLPPPNAHSHGYWHVLSDMKLSKPDPDVFQLPKHCLPTCFVYSDKSKPSSSEQRSTHPLFPWGGLHEHQVEQLRNTLKQRQH